MTATKTSVVGLLAYDGVNDLDVAGPQEVSKFIWNGERA